MAIDDLTLSVTAPSQAGNLRAISLWVQEEISKPFHVRVSLVSNVPGIDPEDMIDQPMSVTIKRENNPNRHFHGIVNSFVSAERTAGGGDHAYEAEIVPRLWFLSHMVDCRVFHDSTSKEIVTKILSENGIQHKFSVNGTLAKRIFTVQYNENNLEFITRLMEEDGLFYFFEHEENSHVVVVANNNQAFPQASLSRMSINAEGGGIASWKLQGAAATGSLALHGYNSKVVTPVKGDLKSIRKASGKEARSVQLWPSRTRESGVATARARVHQEAADAAASLYEGISQNQSLAAGTKFTITSSVLPTDATGDYIVRSISHHAQDGRHTSLGRGVCSNRFTAFPVSTVWRQLPVTARPYMAGIHLAVVLGPEGEEIAVSSEGRIRVRFMWDHRADATSDNTIEVRVMQPWSGNGWGTQHIPRVGTEVAVAFINGDPDDPVVVGCLYNGKNVHPFPLPAEKTKSGIKTRSSLKGGTADYNEFFLDDKKGSELVSLHAQKDHKVVVENDQTSHIMRHLVENVDVNRTRTVGQDETLTVKGKQTETVTGNRTIEIKDGNDTLTVKTGDMSTTVSKGSQSTEISMGNQSTVVSMGNQSTEVKMGNITIKASMGSITVEAMMSIELKVGVNSIKIDPNGVTIQGVMISSSAILKNEVSGLMTDVKGSAMTKVDGAIILIG